MKNKVISLFILSAVFVFPLLIQAQNIDNPLGEDTIIDLIRNIINFIFRLSLPIGALMIVIAGYYFMTSNGDPEKIKKGKDTIIWTLVGILVIFLSLAIIDGLKNAIGIQ
ncbi:pilin [Patescibacteria group bacterium]|nr:pilin [Patescibacteria group bacterium]